MEILLFVILMILGYVWSIYYTINSVLYLNKIAHNKRLKNTKLFWVLVGYFTVGISVYTLFLIYFHSYWASWIYWVPCLLVCLKSFFSSKMLKYLYESVNTGHIIKEVKTVIKFVSDDCDDNTANIE